MKNYLSSRWHTVKDIIQRDWLALTLLLMSWLIFFSPIFFGSQVYFLDDLKIIYYPLEHAYAQAQHAWQLPVWNNNFGFGQPLLAWGQLGFFTPLHIILRALHVPPLTLLQISIATYFALGLGGMYTFLRHRLSSLAAALGSVLYVFCGFHIGHLNHVNFYTATMVLPLLLVSISSFLHLPTLRRGLLISLCGAAMALSGQPQVVLYSTIAAIIISCGLLLEKYSVYLAQPRQLLRLIIIGSIVSVLALGLASFAIFPLFEFLPETERNDALPEIELYEFSYPPLHAITLILPYFFGDHQHYWGPKGFQELAAFVGIIPLLLTGIAIATWRRQYGLRIAALIFLLISVAFALGRYSSLYTALVDAKVLTSLSVPGRFVFFFNVAIALLAAHGLDDLRHFSRRPQLERVITISASALWLGLLLGPFFWYVQQDVTAYNRLRDLMGGGLHWWLAAVGIILFIVNLIVINLGNKIKTVALSSLVVFTAATLLIFSWDYNPRTDRALAFAASPFTDELNAFKSQTGLPARLYSAESIVSKLPEADGVRTTDHIARDFTVHQFIKVRKEGLSCLSIPYQTSQRHEGLLLISLQESLMADPLTTWQFNPDKLTGKEPLELCFPALEQSVGKTFILSFTSRSTTTIKLLYAPYHQSEELAYFVRMAKPTQQQLEASKKQAQILFTPYYQPTADIDVALLQRHLNVLAGASSARWIGALSLVNYRAFIEQFFANDRDPIDGDGVHAIVSFREMVNMSGITHLLQALPHGADDGVPIMGFELKQTFDYGPKELRLYENKAALPKAFLVSNAIFEPVADETRHAMQYQPYAARDLVYIDGPVPPALPQAVLPSANPGTVLIKNYTQTTVDVEVTATEPTFLVVTDSTTPQWQTYLDGQPAPYYRANSIFKAAAISPGNHTVSFRFSSPAVARSKTITLVSLALLIILWLLPSLYSFVTVKRNAAVVSG